MLLWLRLQIFLWILAVAIAGCAEEISLINNLIRRWAPLIWLSPEEKFLPGDVEEFLKHVYPADSQGRSVSDTLPLGQSSKTVYLVTKRKIDLLKNSSSFLHGKDPRRYTIPTYVTIKECYPDHHAVTNFIQFDKRKNVSFQVTYWMFYPYNEGKELCFIGKIPVPFIFNSCLGKVKTIGNHVGDFEHVSMFFSGDTHPDKMFLSAHDNGAYYKYHHQSKVFKYSGEKVGRRMASETKYPPIVRLFNGRPVVFSAQGSHGIWAAPGDHLYTRIPRLYDRSGYGVPWQTWKNVKIHRLGCKPPSWMKYLGRWGNPSSNCFLSQKLGICEFFDGPSSILTRQQDFQCR